MTISNDLFNTSQTFIPGGVNSPVRAFKSVGGTPVFFASGSGAYLTDVDGKRYIDYVGSWGPMIVGHANPNVVSATKAAVERGLSFGAPTEIELRMAETLCRLVPSMEMVRLVSSGTEATMSAIRLARAFTKRDTIVKFEGCYHGHADCLLVKAGSGALTLGVPSSPGVPADLTRHTVSLDYNDSESVKQYFQSHGDKVAAIIVEPIAGNMNCVLPQPGFLEELRRLCTHYGSVLIFDEVMTGFRVALGGAQSLYNIEPDLTTLGKIIGGGLPVGAFGGRQDIMSHIAPSGPVYQAGTLSGNPVALSAGLATLDLVQESGFYDRLSKATKDFTNAMVEAAKSADIALTTNSMGGMFGIFFSREPQIARFAQVMACDVSLFNQFFHAMLRQGVYLAPSAYEAGFLSSAHGKSEIDLTLEAAKVAFAELRSQT